WAAASGGLTFEAWTLFAMLFLWQFPHFMAIAWMYREDYDRAGYQVLPKAVDARNVLVKWQTILPLLALLPVTLVPVFATNTHVPYAPGAFLLSLLFLYYGLKFVFYRSNATARRLLTVSILYLPLIFVLIALLEGS